MLPTLIPLAIEAILTLVTSLLDNIDLLIDAQIALIMGLAERSYKSFTNFNRENTRNSNKNS